MKRPGNPMPEPRGRPPRPQVNVHQATEPLDIDAFAAHLAALVLELEGVDVAPATRERRMGA